MPRFDITATARNASDASSLASWLRRQEVDVSFVAGEESMGVSEVIGGTLSGVAALRAFVTITREWIRAHRTTITLEVEGKGRFVVEGTTDIDRLLQTLQDAPGASTPGV